MNKEIMKIEIDARKKIDEINAMPVLNRDDFEKNVRMVEIGRTDGKRIKENGKRKMRAVKGNH